MTIELPKDTRARAIASIERWFETERDERIGNISASALLGFFLDEFGYWRKVEAAAKKRR